MSRTYEDDVAPAQYLQETGASDVKFARMMLPHTASLWQSLDDNTVCYANRGHLHVGSPAILPQPFSSPSCTVDRKTSGVPPPMASQDINGLSKPHSRPTQHKNQTAKQHSVMTRSSPSSKTSTLLGSSSSPSALELHYQLYGRSSYRLSFGRPRFAKHRAARPMAHSMPALSRSHQSPQHNHNTHHHDDGNSSHPQPHAHAQDVDAAADGSQSHSRSSAETASPDAYAEHQVGDDCVDTHHRHNDNDADHDDDDESVVGTADVSRHKDNGKLQETRKTIQRMFEPARFPPIQEAAPPAFQRTMSEKNLRRTRKLPVQEMAKKQQEWTRPLSMSLDGLPTGANGTSHTSPPRMFPRPYRQTAEGDRIQAPGRQQMLKSILESHPPPNVNVGKSLYHYDFRHHSITGLRDARRPGDGLAPRWK